MTCKDCLHYDVCGEVFYQQTGEIKSLKNSPICSYFKDKSKAEEKLKELNEK